MGSPKKEHAYSCLYSQSTGTTQRFTIKMITYFFYICTSASVYIYVCMFFCRSFFRKSLSFKEFTTITTEHRFLCQVVLQYWLICRLLIVLKIRLVVLKTERKVNSLHVHEDFVLIAIYYRCTLKEFKDIEILFSEKI